MTKDSEPAAKLYFILFLYENLIVIETMTSQEEMPPMGATNNPVDAVKELILKREKMEKELKALGEVLESHYIGMDEPLVDADGFPRSDVDINTVRSTRVQIIYIQNDLKKVMQEIEDGLHDIHAAAREGKIAFPKQSQEDESHSLKPFLKVDHVTAGSPAKAAGLEVNDLIMKFGSITISNFSNLQTISSVVKNSENHGIPITIRRGESVTQLSLTPKKWTGRGLLGCNIVHFK